MCADLSSSSQLLSNIKPLVERPECVLFNVIVKGDIGDFDDSTFAPNNWSLHLSQISHILSLNLSCTNTKLTISQSLDSVLNFFPPRLLRPSEKSLVTKHYHALSDNNDVSLILEDDASFIDLESNCDDIISILQFSLERNYFIDFGFYSGLQKRGRLEYHNHVPLYHHKIACTRTTVAFALLIP